jgi:hypothetical protein
MSELTRCNYCTFKAIKKRKKEKDKMKIVSEDGGTSIYINDKFVVWFMSLPDHCCC